MKNFLEGIEQNIISSLAFFDLVKDPVFLMKKEQDSFRYAYANQSALALLPVQDILGRKIEDVLPLEQSRNVTQFHHQAYDTGEAVEFIEKINLENGVFVGESVLNPIIAEDGQGQYILTIIRDVTERESKKQALQETQRGIEVERKRLHSLVENNANAVFEFDQQKNFTSINRMVTDVTGFSEEELLGQSIVSFVVESHLEETLAHFDQALNGKSVEFETAIYTKSQQLAQFYVNAIPIIIDETVIGVYAVTKEITEQKRMESLLRESEQRYKSLFANHPHGIFTFDRSGNLDSVNAGAVNITGYSAKELLAASFVTILLPDEIEKVRDHFRKTIHDQQTQRYEIAFHHRNGQLIDLQAINIPIIVDGQLVGIHGIVTDVTERNRAQKALTEAKEELEVFWENSTDPIFFIDTKGDILRVNPAFEETFEFTEEEMVTGKGSIIPQHMIADQFAIVERIVNGETVNSHDTIRMTKSGKPLNIISSYSPVRNASKKVVGATIIYKNVTELKKAERELQKSQEKYKVITESTFDIITLINLSGLIEYVSPANEKILGYPDHVYVGSPFTTNVHPEDAFDLMESVTSLIDGGEPATVEIRFLHRDGHYIWMEVSPTPVIENGEVKQLFTIARDITERRRLQDKIAKMAFYDHLSGIPNRRTFDDKLHKAILQADSSGKKMGILMLDGRKFKQINDQFGHDAGDAVIKEMALRLQACVRPIDTAARLGGDEMAVVLSEITSSKEAEDIAERILQSYEKPLIFNGFHIKIGAGIGIAIYPDHASTEKQLIKCADMALYEAKKSDKDEYRIYQ